MRLPVSFYGRENLIPHDLSQINKKHFLVSVHLVIYSLINDEKGGEVNEL